MINTAAQVDIILDDGECYVPIEIKHFVDDPGILLGKIQVLDSETNRDIVTSSKVFYNSGMFFTDILKTLDSVINNFARQSVFYIFCYFNNFKIFDFFDNLISNDFKQTTVLVFDEIRGWVNKGKKPASPIWGSVSFMFDNIDKHVQNKIRATIIFLDDDLNRLVSHNNDGVLKQSIVDSNHYLTKLSGSFCNLEIIKVSDYQIVGIWKKYI